MVVVVVVVEGPAASVRSVDDIDEVIFISFPRLCIIYKKFSMQTVY